ncbi:Cobalamin synthesis protein, partial [Globisporangium splendens]
MNNGCICCTVRGDLIRTIQQILKRSTGKHKLDGIIIETTGIAVPVHSLRPSSSMIRSRKSASLTVSSPSSTQNIPCSICSKSNLRVENESFESHDLDKILVKEPDFLDNTDHMHDTSVTSVDFQSTDAINAGLLQDWIQEMSMTKGNDLLRRKGVINVAGMDNKFAFQGVHMLFDGGFVATKWKQDEPWETRFVFIGKNHEQLTKEFLACKALPLRFKVGDRVLAHVETGEIVQVWDRAARTAFASRKHETMLGDPRRRLTRAQSQSARCVDCEHRSAERIQRDDSRLNPTVESFNSNVGKAC